MYQLKPFLESTFALVIRGITIIFPTIQIAVVYMLVVLTVEKFEYLAHSAELTINHIGARSGDFICVNTPLTEEMQQMKTKNKFEKVK